MSNTETIATLKNFIESRKCLREQLSTLQAKETAISEKAAELSKLLERAKHDQEICLRANLAGNASDQELKAARDSVKMLTESLREAGETCEMGAKLRAEVTHEINSINDAIAAHRAMLCRELMEKPYTEIRKNAKLHETLLAGYALFRKAGEYDTSWARFILNNFPPPSESDMDVATKKLKASNAILNESL